MHERGTPSMLSAVTACQAMQGAPGIGVADSPVWQQIWAQFDADGDGELSYDQLLQLLHRQLPQLERSEMRQLLGYLHEIDIDGTDESIPLDIGICFTIADSNILLISSTRPSSPELHGCYTCKPIRLNLLQESMLPHLNAYDLMKGQHEVAFMVW